MTYDAPSSLEYNRKPSPALAYNPEGTEIFWGAKWIAPAGARDKRNYYFRARKIFEVNNIAENSTLRIAAESSYILYLNGVELGRGPARGTRALNYYDSYPISSSLQIGRNEIDVLCLCQNIETFVAAPAEPALMVEVPSLLKTDGTWQVAPAEDEWKSDVMLYTVQTGFSEWRDLRKEPIGWLASDDSSPWEPAVCLEASSRVYQKRLLPRGIPFLQETIYRPVTVPAVARVPKATDPDEIQIARLMDREEHLEDVPLLAKLSHLIAGKIQDITIAPTTDSGIAIIFDFGRQIVGRFEIEISASSGTIVDIGHEEQLTGRRLRVAHEDAKGERYDLVDRYILRDGRQWVGNSLMERGFRLVQIVVRNLHGPLTIHQVRAVDRRYPLGLRANFRCSDPLLNTIWDACVETLSACTTDIFTDCPWRERSFWVNDLLVENLIFIQLSGDRSLPARAMQMVFSETAGNGLVNGVCPCPIEGKDEDWLSLPATNLFLALILRDYLFYTGDMETVRKHLPRILRILDQFEHFTDAQGAVTFPSKYWNFFDWSYEANQRSLRGKTSAALSYLLLIARKAYAELMAYTTGESAPIANCPTEHQFTTLTQVFYDSESNRLSDDIENGQRSSFQSQLAHALALLAGENPDELPPGIVEGVTDSELLIPELYLHHFIFAAQKKMHLTENGLERIRKYWGRIVTTGSPTIWEFGVYLPGKEALDGKGSLCHGFTTSPIDFFQTVILGISPRQPGFTEFSVDPHPFDLTSATGSVPTPSGDIRISWNRSTKGLSVTLEVPQGCRAITPGNKQLESGTHHFEVTEKSFACKTHAQT